MNWVGTGTATELISVDSTLKSHAQLTGAGTSYDALLTAYVAAASKEIENKAGYPLRYEAVKVFDETLNKSILKLPKNVASVTTYEYWDGEVWVEQTFTVDPVINVYQLCSEILHDEIRLYTKYRLTCVATLNASDLIKQVCRMKVAAMFEVREDHETKYNDSIGDQLLRTESVLIS